MMGLNGAGALDRLVEIRTAVEAVSGTGGITVTFPGPHTTAWAAMAPVSDGEKLRAGIVEARAMARFTVRYSATTAAITARDRLGVDGAEWQVTGLKEVGRREWIEISAERTV